MYTMAFLAREKEKFDQEFAQFETVTKVFDYKSVGSVLNWA